MHRHSDVEVADVELAGAAAGGTLQLPHHLHLLVLHLQENTGVVLCVTNKLLVERWLRQNILF